MHSSYDDWVSSYKLNEHVVFRTFGYAYSIVTRVKESLSLRRGDIPYMVGIAGLSLFDAVHQGGFVLRAVVPLANRACHTAS